MGKYRPITSAYINNTIYDNYLNDEERQLIQRIDFDRYTAYQNRNKYNHFTNDIFVKLFDLNIAIRQDIYGRYILDHRDKPDKALQDLTTTINNITPAAFYADMFTNKSYLESECDNVTMFIENQFIYLCDPMIKALTGHTAHLTKASRVISKRARECAKYAMKKFDEEGFNRVKFTKKTGE